MTVPAWLAGAFICLVVVLIGYLLVWPKGTLAHGRTLHLPAALIFGIVWGLSEGQLFLSFWAIPEKFGLPWIWTAVISVG